MRRLPPTLLLILPCMVGAQPTPRSLLWSVSAPMGAPSYLYATFHSRDARVFQFQDSVLIAFDGCDLVAGELDVDQTRKMDQAVTNAMLLPSGGSLDRLYSKRDYKRVIGVLKERLGPLAPLCTKVRPYYTIAMLTEMELGSDSALVLDAWFQQRAEHMDKKVVGLESIAEQLAAVERIPLRDQARLLYSVIARDSTDGDLTEAVNAYTARDLDALMDIVERDGLPEHADKALLDERNTRMTDRLVKQIESGHRVFAAIGAAHLPGEDGMIAGLRARGFDVHPVAPVVDSTCLPAVEPLAPRITLLPPSIELKKGVHVRNDTLGYSVDMPKAPVKQVIRDDDSLRVVIWSSTSDLHDELSITTSEGPLVAHTDARARIEELRQAHREEAEDPTALTRIDGFQAFEHTTPTGARTITVATPARTHVFAISNGRVRSRDFADRVIRSIRIHDGGAGP